MSILGPSGMGRIPLASSAAASAHTPANTDEVQAQRDQARLHSDEAKMAARAHGDEFETETAHGQVSDRDPDGRLPWTIRRAPGQEEEEPEGEPEKKPTSPDSESGRALDVDV